MQASFFWSSLTSTFWQHKNRLLLFVTYIDLLATHNPPTSELDLHRTFNNTPPRRGVMNAATSLAEYFYLFILIIFWRDSAGWTHLRHIFKKRVEIRVAELILHGDKIQNTKRFKRTLVYFDTNTQYAHFRGNALCQATKWHLADKRLETMKN